MKMLEELIETAKSWEANGRVFRKMAQNCNEHLKDGYDSIAISFEGNAKIVKVIHAILTKGEEEKEV
jgi:hypothetical protein